MIDKKIIEFERRANASNVYLADDLKQMLRNVIFFNRQAMLNWIMEKVKYVKYLQNGKEVEMFCLK